MNLMTVPNESKSREKVDLCYISGRILKMIALFCVQEGLCILLPVSGRPCELGSGVHHQRLM